MLSSLSQRFPTFFERAPDFIQLMRLDRPIGIWLLLWPTLWAVYIAGNGNPDLRILVVFTLGVILMRSAGCVINDFADRNVDGHVERTKDRPLAAGKISSKEALITFAVLIGLSAALLPFLNIETFYWSFGALALASIYPFMKRFTFMPQVVLGAAFSWAIPMAFVAQGQTPDTICWLLYAANLAWTVAYDTQYAMADREDDLKIGVKSTAILFGDMDLAAIGFLQGIFFIAMWMLGNRLGLAWPYDLALIVGALGLFWYQFHISKSREPQACIVAFLNNHWVGGALFVGLFLGYVFK